MGGISAFAVILTQLDKIILSKMLSLEMFGYYVLASVVAMSLGRLVLPVFNGIYPRFAQLVSIDNQDELTRLYHKSCQFMSVLILPVAIVIALFSYEIILIWTHDPSIAVKSHLFVSILICGTALNGLMTMPFALQLAFGWTRLSFYKAMISVIVLVPLIIYMTILYGATGAAIAWLILNISIFFLEIPIMHRRLLRTEKWRWYLQDVCFPLITSIFVAGLGRIFMGRPMSEFKMVLYLISILLLTVGITAITTSTTRFWLFEHVLKIKLICYFLPETLD